MIINKIIFKRVFKEKKCSNGRVERLTQGLWGLALYYNGHDQIDMKILCCLMTVHDKR